MRLVQCACAECTGNGCGITGLNSKKNPKPSLTTGVETACTGSAAGCGTTTCWGTTGSTAGGGGDCKPSVAQKAVNPVCWQVSTQPRLAGGSQRWRQECS